MIQLTAAASLACAAFVLIVGRVLTGRIAFLEKYSIPKPVSGGILAAMLVLALRQAGLEVRFDTAMQPNLMLAFFATIGLGADLKMIARGGRALVYFFLCVVAILILQNLVGTGLAVVLGVDPRVGILAGSVAMSGGHGTGAAWGATFESAGLAGASGIALAAATFGLIAGGIIGGPVGRRLAERAIANGVGPVVAAPREGDGAEASGAFTADRLIVTIFLIAVSVAAGSVLARWAANPAISLPNFVWVLFTGVVLRNALAALKWHEVDAAALDFTGVVSLSLFLAMALMGLRLWEVASLAGPMLVIIAAQVALVAVFTSTVTFRVMGSNYDAAVLCAGQCGFGLGATPTAIANMQAITDRFGPSPQAFLLVPIVGAFMIDIANAVVISAFAKAVG
jgi:ESS family glutamate:Na+ symporter